MLSDTLIRFSLPSKGVLSDGAFNLLAAAGLRVVKPNPRQYLADIPALSGLKVILQRPGDIVVGVQQGSVDFGIAGLDMIEEKRSNAERDDILIIHDSLGFGDCALMLAVPENWESVADVASLKKSAATLPHPLRVATKFPNLTERFLSRHDIPHTLIYADGTLEIAPTIGYADIISDLVSSGQTLSDNRLRPLTDGLILPSQAVLIANREALKTRPEALEMARRLLEYIEAHLRAKDNLLVIANMRGDSAATIAEKIFSQTDVGGLQGPTISPIGSRDGSTNWHSVSVVVRRDHLPQAITELRRIGGSGIIVSPITYIFEEEPPRYTAMLAALKVNGN
jgi:ATP phosphoribosyltransferase